MKQYVFEIHVKDDKDGLLMEFLEFLLEEMLTLLGAFAVEIVTAGVAEESEAENA